MELQKLQKGRPERVPQIEEMLGLPLEHYMMQEMAKRRSTKQICASLKIHPDTVRKHLRKKGWRIYCDCKLVPIESDQLHPGQGPAAG